jgi:hypothetical protein
MEILFSVIRALGQSLIVFVLRVNQLKYKKVSIAFLKIFFVVKQANSSFSALVLGYPPSQMQGKRIEDLIPGFYDEFDVPSCDR